MKRMQVATIVYWGIAAVVFILAAIGYLLAGEAWYDAIYYTAQLFVMEYSSVDNANALIYVCRVLCPVMTATGLAALVRDLHKIIADGIVSRTKDATAVYYDSEEMKQYARSFKYPVLMKNAVNKKVMSHVLLFKQDSDNLTFYEQLKEQMAPGSKVYLKLDKVESRLLRSSEVYYFNANEIVARIYWKERTLEKYYSSAGIRAKVAIIGFGTVGKNLLDYGLMNNIYSLNQRIEYHIWGDTVLYRNQLGSFDRMNGDTITFHESDWKDDLEQLKKYDRIIVAQEPDVELIQALLYLNSNAEIDVYNPQGIDLEKIYVGDRLKSFGILSEVLTEENIKTDKLYRLAKEINYDYVVNEDKKKPFEERKNYTWDRFDVEGVMEEKWSELNGFLKGSNVASADYHEIRLLVMRAMGMDKDKLSEQELEQLAEMEHIRWSRYHYVNHWRHNEARDDSKRLHNLLKPYAELKDKEKEKDRNAVGGLLTNPRMQEK